MRIILKIIAAPFVLVLTLLVAALSFLLSLSAGVLSILASLLGILSALIIVWEGDMQTGVAGLIMAFAISPFGLPALAGWLLASWTISTTPCGASSQADTSGHGGQKMQKRRLTTAAVCHIERRAAHGHNLYQTS